jgi:predicted short-subunit dehydrogenase-like oxidoreductase (DUF2520 family)
VQRRDAFSEAWELNFPAKMCAGILPEMARPRTARVTIAIIGAGSLGTALAISLRASGYRVTEILSRAQRASRERSRALAHTVGARAGVVGNDECTADVIWLCVPDREIRNYAKLLAPSGQWSGRVVLHSSGALTSDELAALRKRGAAVASAHPLMTFVPGESPSLTAVPFAIEGDPAAMRIARRIARDLGAAPFEIEKASKAAYHAWGAFASPLLVSLLVTAERVAGEAGISRMSARKMMLPILRQTLENYAQHGPAGALSGPIIRGDSATLTKHLKVLRRLPEAKEIYLALSRSAVRNLAAKNKGQLLRTLA